MKCTLIPAIGDLIHVPCPECGHLNSLHVGCECCPVCELLELIEHATTKVSTPR